MSFRIGAWLLALTAWLACAGGGAPPPRVESAGGSPLLWRAEAEGRGPVFLFGSVHFGTPDLLELGGALGRAWERSEELVVEVDLSRVSSQDFTAAMLRYGVLPEGQSLQSQLSPETWRLLSQALQARALPVASVEHTKPWLVWMQLSAAQIQQAGLDPQYGVDSQLIVRAAGRKPIVELEGLERQFALLDSLSPELQDLMLRELLDQADETGTTSSQIVESWRQGDEEALVELFFGSVEEAPELAGLYEKIFFERNESMSRRLAELARDGKTRFAVVGAGHMLGPRGIPQLLAKQGFRVERLR